MLLEDVIIGAITVKSERTIACQDFFKAQFPEKTQLLP